ncbi:MAG: hypothetical protein HY706_05110 [Candidatus Hydrogenedentes bacterium]|nr:hypothetical protein [Candidatus Hydrogenedentota bacterium]
MPNAKEIYVEHIRTLPMSERLRLATIILEDLSTSGAPLLDYADSWSQEDMRDAAAYSLQRADAHAGDQRIV